MENLIYILIIAFALFTVFRFESKDKKSKNSEIQKYANKHGFKITKKLDMLILDKESRRFFIADYKGMSGIVSFNDVTSFEITTSYSDKIFRYSYPFDGENVQNAVDELSSIDSDTVEKLSIIIPVSSTSLYINILSENSKTRSYKYKKAVSLTKKISGELVGITNAK